MKKFAHIFALLILLIGSSFDTLELLVPVQKTCAPAEKNQHSKNTQRELVNDELIINRHSHQLSVTAGQKSIKSHLQFLSAEALQAQQLQHTSSAIRPAKQLPGYGTLFRYYLF